MIPMCALYFLGTIALVLAGIEIGYRVGLSPKRQSKGEKEPTVSAIVASILALLAFMLAFTFNIVSNRFEERKLLVREEANAIGTAYLRSDFLAEQDRAKAAELYKNYLDIRLNAALKSNRDEIKALLVETANIQKQLWDMAVRNARTDMHSDIGALYIEALNHVIDVHGLRVNVGLELRLPIGIWLVLFSLVSFSMLGLGYLTAISGSKRSLANIVLAFAFSIVIAMIVSLDRPERGLFEVSQQPLLNLQKSLANR